MHLSLGALFGPTQLILAGLFVGIGGQLGDLSISVIKRDVGAKDMCSSIPVYGWIIALGIACLAMKALPGS